MTLGKTVKPRWRRYGKLYEFYATGRGEFPVDMLRYDQCWPADTDSALQLLDNGSDRATRSLRMHSFNEPTVDRWHSFMWSVGVERL